MDLFNDSWCVRPFLFVCFEDRSKIGVDDALGGSVLGTAGSSGLLNVAAPHSLEAGRLNLKPTGYQNVGLSSTWRRVAVIHVSILFHISLGHQAWPIEKKTSYNMGVSKNRGVSPKMDDENHGKPYFLMG